jgi:hypothetical protein
VRLSLTASVADCVEAAARVAEFMRRGWTIAAGTGTMTA